MDLPKKGLLTSGPGAWLAAALGFCLGKLRQLGSMSGASAPCGSKYMSTTKFGACGAESKYILSGLPRGAWFSESFCPGH